MWIEEFGLERRETEASGVTSRSIRATDWARHAWLAGAIPPRVQYIVGLERLLAYMAANTLAARQYLAAVLTELAHRLGAETRFLQS
jgi:hypothetical protein